MAHRIGEPPPLPPQHDLWLFRNFFSQGLWAILVHYCALFFWKNIGFSHCYSLDSNIAGHIRSSFQCLCFGAPGGHRDLHPLHPWTPPRDLAGVARSQRLVSVFVGQHVVHHQKPQTKGWGIFTPLPGCEINCGQTWNWKRNDILRVLHNAMRESASRAEVCVENFVWVIGVVNQQLMLAKTEKDREVTVDEVMILDEIRWYIICKVI